MKNKNMRAQKRPTIVECLQWTGDNHRTMFEFLGGPSDQHMTSSNDNFYIDHSKVEGGLIIKTSEGDMCANKGDFILKEPFDKERKYYPCKKEVFYQTYEVIPDISL